MAEPVTEVRILNLPGLGPKEDVSDWLDRGGTREELLVLAAAAEPLPRTDPPSPDGAAPPMAPAAIAVVPPLPSSAALSAEAQTAACAVRAQWVDPFIAAAQALTPRTPRSMLEACALFAVCLAIARRCFIRTGATRHFPAFYALFVGRSTVRAKTTALNLLRQLLREAGLTDLLLPSSFTPQALLADLALWVPPNVREGAAGEQQRWLERHRHAAARGILRDEASGLFEDCSKDYNAGLLPLLLKLDGAPDSVDLDLTVSRGLTEAHDVCIGLLGATTPAALRAHVARPQHWHNGMFGRFALIAPDDEPAWSFWRDPEPFPLAVPRGLQRLYTSLPLPGIRFLYTDPDAGGKPGQPRITGAEQDGYAPVEATLTPAARAAYREYDRALFLIAARPEHPERLDPTYGRLPSLALRVALGLSVLDWALEGAVSHPAIGLGHWAAAQAIAERWRADAHRILADALDGGEQAAERGAADRLVAVLRHGRLKRGDVLRSLNWTAAELDRACAAAGDRIVQVTETTGGRPALYLQLAGTVADEPAAGDEPDGEFEEGSL